MSSAELFGIPVLKEVCSPSLSRKIFLGSSKAHGGRGLYAKEFIPAGEVVYSTADVVPTVQRNWAFLSSIPAASRERFLHFSYCKHAGACSVRPRATCRSFVPSRFVADMSHTLWLPSLSSAPSSLSSASVLMSFHRLCARRCR